jgi:hypothetical protein
LLKFHMLEVQHQRLADVQCGVAHAPVMQAVWHGLGCPARNLRAWCAELVGEMAASGVLALRDGEVHDA